MDRTETHYVSYDAEEIWREMMLTYYEAGGDTLYPGDEKAILLRAVQSIALAVLARVDTALRMDTLTYAMGDYLKLYGEKRNCFYIEAVPATAPLRITFRASGTARTIPAGTEVTADGVVIYQLAEDVLQTGDEQVVQTTIECTTPGAIGNGLQAGTQMQFIESNNGVVSAIVTADASGGMDAEDMEAYRERIHHNGLAAVTTGPQFQYESKALAASTQILDARALNDGAGEVGVYLLLAEGADQTTVFQAVENALSAVDTRPLTDHVILHAVEEVPYTLKVCVWYSAFSKLDGDVQATIDSYQAWQDNEIGRAFNPDRLIAMLYQLGVDRVQFLEGSGMNGSLNYQKIDERKRCKGSITLEVKNDEN